MKFRINKKIFGKYPKLKVGIIICERINNSGKNEVIIS